MAKNKKSKILAMALCASVMTGIYASPVMAAELYVDNSGNQLVTTKDSLGTKITELEGLKSIISDSFATTPINGNSAFWVNKDGKLVAANRQFTVDTNGSVYISPNGVQREATVVLNADTGIVTATNFATEDYNLVDIGNKTQNINNWTTADTTAFDGSVIADSFGTTKVNGNRAFWVNKDGMMEAAYGKFAVDAEGNITTVGTVDGVNMENLKGIERTDVTDGVGTTTIEGDFAVNGKDNTFGSKNGSFTVNAEDGTFTAAKGAFKVREGVGETVIAGSIISSKDILGNYGSLNGSQLTLRAINGESTLIDAGRVSIDNGSSSTIISGGDITAETLNDKVIDDLVEGSDIADDLANIGGISRQQDKNGVFSTNIEGTLTVSENGLNATKGDSQINLNESGINLSNGDAMIAVNDQNIGIMYNTDNFISVDANGIGLKGNVVFDTEHYGSYSLSGLVDKVEDIYNRTQGIDYDSSTGTTTIDGNLDVKGDTETGAGGNENVKGDITAGGDITAEGDVNGTNGNFDKVTTGEISADKGNIGNSHFDENGITVGAAGGQHTTITDTTVDATNGYFDNLQADKADIGGVGLEGGTVTADKVVTGNTTLDNEGLNVGGQTSVTADGVNVGGNGGTTVSKDGVSIADKTIISDHDVVINEGTADRVSLSETADRVGNLEQGVSELNNRVGKLEDRIDKVGAMAAAIANLRTMGYDPAAPTEVAVGIGQYRDETGAALGLFHYPNRDFMLSLSVSTSGDEVMGGIGATWKFGRKSPEKVAEIKKAQAEADVRRAEEAKLAKAEEMKKAAKEAKIKAQQERHAKLAAERAAQAEAAK